MSPQIIFNGISFRWDDTVLTITIPRDALTFLQFSILIRLLNNISEWKFRVVPYEEHIELVSVSRCRDRDDCPILECSIEIEGRSNLDIHIYLSCFDTVRFSKIKMRSLYYYEVENFRVEMSEKIGLTPKILEQVEDMLRQINPNIHI